MKTPRYSRKIVRSVKNDCETQKYSAKFVVQCMEIHRENGIMDRAFCREKEQRTTNEEELDMSILDVFALLGGVGLFLYGMMQMSDGLKNAAGDHLRIILEKATRNRVVSVLVGVLVTLMIQSSSATDVMVIGFVNSGLMNLSQALGVIM